MNHNDGTGDIYKRIRIDVFLLAADHISPRLIKRLPVKVTFVDFDFVAASQFLLVTVLDENSDPVGSTRIEYRNDSLDISGNGRTDANGVVVMPVLIGVWVLRMDSDPSIGYLAPEIEVTVSFGDDTVKVDFGVFAADETISGTVTDNVGIDLRNDLRIDASVNDNGTYYRAVAAINNHGSFEIAISSTFSAYEVHAWLNNAPVGVGPNPDYIADVAPGANDLGRQVAPNDGGGRVHRTVRLDQPAAIKQTRRTLRGHLGLADLDQLRRGIGVDVVIGHRPAGRCAPWHR